MTKTLALAFALPLALAAGCGGKAAKSCTISTSGTTKTLTCPDGTTAVVSATGMPGPAGASSLANVVDEPAGANCPAGGKAIETGPDTNGNGTLDPSEVLYTTYVCDSVPSTPTVVTGDFFAQNSLDLASLAGVSTISGTLTISDTGEITAISLPDLVHVGTLDIEGEDGFTSVSLPALTTVDTNLTINDNDDPTIATLDFSALTTVGGLELDSLAITSLSTFAKVNSVGEHGLSLYDLGSLTSLDGLEGALASATEIDIEFDESVTDVSALDSTKTVAYLKLKDLGATSLSFAALTSCSDLVELEDLSALTSVSFPKLSAGTVYLTNDDMLTTVSFPMLPAADVVFNGTTTVSTCTFSDATSCP